MLKAFSVILQGHTQKNQLQYFLWAIFVRNVFSIAVWLLKFLLIVCLLLDVCKFHRSCQSNSNGVKYTFSLIEGNCWKKIFVCIMSFLTKLNFCVLYSICTNLLITYSIAHNNLRIFPTIGEYCWNWILKIGMRFPNCLLRRHLSP